MAKAPNQGLILKFSIFATGLSGIVAEFVLSTLATYLTGNAVFQWTMVMSIMLFAMGLGSRLSRLVRQRLLDNFILIEFTLSVLCASSAALAYGLAVFTSFVSLIIYTLAFIIGALIGFEIPLVTRLNENYEELRANISGVMEKDYYGALIGGLFFAFFALPHLGLTYTPIVLGSVNFIVAAVLLKSLYNLVEKKARTIAAFCLALACLVALAFVAKPVILYGEQKQYKDKVIYADQTPYQKIVMTQWKDYYWLFINGQEQFSTYDEEKYHEPLVHPAMKLAPRNEKILILGGGDGLALREIIKHQGVKSVTMVDLDKAMTDLAVEHPILAKINQGSMKDKRLKIVNGDAAAFLREHDNLFDVIIIDLPDPDSVDLVHLYSESFYRLVKRHLARGGVAVTQAASPLFARKAFLCVNRTMEAAGFTVAPYHNQVPTMGEWGWVLGVRNEELRPDRLKELLTGLDFSDLETRFISREAMVSMANFGKDVFTPGWQNEIEVNTQARPVIQTYYAAGSWGVY